VGGRVLTHEQARQRAPGWRLAGYVGETVEPAGEIVYLERFNTERRQLETVMAWFATGDGAPELEVTIDGRGYVVTAAGRRIS
jgi:hypothetical protein